MQKKRFLANIFIMSSSMMFMRIAGMLANIYISAKAGAVAMGMYHMIFSVFTFGITFASSGTGFAATRLISENRANPKSIIAKCLRIAFVMSIIGFGVFFFSAPIIQKKIHQKPKCCICPANTCFCAAMHGNICSFQRLFYCKAQGCNCNCKFYFRRSCEHRYNLSLFKKVCRNSGFIYEPCVRMPFVEFIRLYIRWCSIPLLHRKFHFRNKGNKL